MKNQKIKCPAMGYIILFALMVSTNLQAIKSETAEVSGDIISDVVIYDISYGDNWSIKRNLQVSDTIYRNRTDIFDQIPANLIGQEWVSAAYDSKSFTGENLMDFTLTKNAVVFILHCDDIVSKPDWLSNWTDTGDDATNSEAITYSVFSRSFSAGDQVSLGVNGNTSSSMYVVVVVPLTQNASEGSITVQNGWYVETNSNKTVWGYAAHNAWWRAGQRPNITRNAVDNIGPNRTEDLDLLTDALKEYGTPGFEHNFGLWYDRRRDAHDTGCRSTPAVEFPTLEQPWARSNGASAACDGLAQYDLTTFNSLYFNRLREFSALADEKGVILFNNHYMQHALLELQTHYVDFPWRAQNNINNTNMPNSIPAANALYDTSNQVHADLHRLYIRKQLSELQDYTNVVHLPSLQYTGSISFIEFWIDTVLEWSAETGNQPHIGIGATKDVLDLILQDPIRGPAIKTIDLRYWWYESDGTLFAPPGGQEVPGRYTLLDSGSATSPESFYTQILEYRSLYPDKAIIHFMGASREQTWAFLMGGGSLLTRSYSYQDNIDPINYIEPKYWGTIQTSYEFVNNHLATRLSSMSPKQNIVMTDPESNWVLANPGETYLAYMLNGGDLELDLSGDTETYAMQWFNPRTGTLSDMSDVVANQVVEFNAPDNVNDWVLLLTQNAEQQILANGKNLRHHTRIQHSPAIHLI